MDKHVIRTREEQLDWVDSLAPTHIQTSQHESEMPCIDGCAPYFKQRSLAAATLAIGATRTGKTRLSDDLLIRPINGKEGV